MLHLRSLRHRVLLLFAILAVGPLLALGLLDYTRARRAVERLIIAHTDASAKQAAQLIGERYALIQSDALLLSDNAETQDLFTRLATGDSMQINAARAAVDTFVATVWSRSGSVYDSVEIGTANGTVLKRVVAEHDTVSGRKQDPLAPFIQPITQPGASLILGSVRLYPLTTTLLPTQLSGTLFGRTGYLLLVDSSTKTVLYDSRGSGRSLSVESVVGPAVAELNALPGGVGTIQYGVGDSTRIASSAMVDGSSWMVLSSAAITESTAGLDSSRFRDLALVIVLAIAVALVFAFLIGRTTQSLEQLTLAAEAVGRGDLTPQLPPVSKDEVGTLSGAFDHMLLRVRTMMFEIETSRQLAVLGEFSAQLSHEIRNPLTSLKLNLQGLSRDVRRGKIPPEAAPPVDTCLREVNRLDGVVRGVLELARPRSGVRDACSMHSLLDRVLDVHAAQLVASNIVVVREFGAQRDVVSGNSEQLVGLFTNLVVNASEAQPSGGRLLLSTVNHGDLVSISIADDGPGPPPALAEHIFRPFVSGKPTGTGLGLSMALNAARDHGGTIEMTTAPVGYSGATFCVRLPLA